MGCPLFYGSHPSIAPWAQRLLVPNVPSLGEFLGYWDWFWYPGLSPVLVSITFPFAFHISVFFHSLLILLLPVLVSIAFPFAFHILVFFQFPFILLHLLWI